MSTMKKESEPWPLLQIILTSDISMNVKAKIIKFEEENTEE